MRKTVFPVLILLLCCCCLAQAGMPNPFRRIRAAKGGMLPATGEVPDLVLKGKILTYREKTFQDFYGTAGNVFIRYGFENMLRGEYTYGGNDRRVTIEIAVMETPTAAAGIFHHHRGTVIGPNNGMPVDVGAEGIVDKGREMRNLYFYRSKYFCKIVYSGKEPVPDLTPIARHIDSEMPGGNDAKPEGFTFIDVPGVAINTVGLTPGFCFNLSFFPPAVFASAPGGGSVASDIFIITRNKESEAAGLYKDYVNYLKMFANYIEEYRRGRQSYVKSVDPNQGRVVFTAYRNALIIAARPDGYEKGEALIEAIMAKMDEVNPPKRRR